MGAIAEAIVTYAQPLLDETDGSLPEEKREESLNELRSSLEMDDEEFASFRSSIVEPMIRRHHELFPRMHRQGSTDRFPGGPSQSSPAPRVYSGTTTTATEKYPGTERYAPCPCNSGRKYKFCCWARER